VVDGAAVAAGRFADDPEAIARQRAADDSLDHDNPLEEVYEDQLLCADLVVLNKADLMSADERRDVVGQIGKTLPKAVKVIEVQNGKVSVSVLLGVGAAAEADLESRPSHHDLEGEHDHDDFDTFVIDLPSVSSPQALIDRIAKATGAHDILRVKGFAEIAGKPMRLLVQGVGARIQHQFDRPWGAGESRQGRLVVIGETGFDKAAIRDLILG
jgi:cobalamin biosynthesis protein CobW